MLQNDAPKRFEQGMLDIRRKQFCFSVPLVFSFFNEVHVGQLIKFQSNSVAANVQLLF
jgi:hypothetical protein